jgi:hypothetical protein
MKITQISVSAQVYAPTQNFALGDATKLRPACLPLMEEEGSRHSEKPWSGRIKISSTGRSVGGRKHSETILQYLVRFGRTR